MWHHVKGNCNRQPCDFSHDEKLKLYDGEKKLCAEEMNVRLLAKGKGGGKNQAQKHITRHPGDQLEGEGDLHEMESWEV